jgi:hypothetical protein
MSWFDKIIDEYNWLVDEKLNGAADDYEKGELAGIRRTLEILNYIIVFENDDKYNGHIIEIR